jgi:arsenate reductase
VISDPAAMTIRIFHNPRCSKSRQTLQLIRDAGVEPEVVEYLESPPSVQELDAILKMLGIEAGDLMRKGELIYRELGLATRDLSREEAIKLLHQHPQLIERPIVVKGDRAVIGRPPENVEELL